MRARLEWELRYQRDGFSVRAAIDKGRPLPDWYLAKPAVDPVEHFYLQAFWRLSRGRAISDSHVGPIPWRDIVWYADRQGIDADLLEAVITEMDAAYLQWQADAAKRKADKPPPERPQTIGAG